MREDLKRSLFRAAIEVLVERKVAAKNPADPAAYAGTVRADLLTRYRVDCRDILRDLDDDDGIDAETLATMLEPPKPAPAPKWGAPEPHNPAASMPLITAEGWKPLPQEQRQHNVERIRAIRESLRKEDAKP